MNRFAARREKLRKALRKTGADALLVTDFKNVTYLTGFTGDDSLLLVGADGSEVCLTDGRYTTQLGEECPGLELFVRRPGMPVHAAAARLLRSAKVGRLAVEADAMTLALRDRMVEKLPRLEVVSTSGLVERQRQVKDREEIAAIRRAIDLAQRGFGVIRAALRPEKTEKQVADELEHQMRLFGAAREGFPSIVAAGPRAALPHAVPGAHPVGESDFLLIDWGARADLYHSDLTRVLVTGRISPKFRRIYEIVRKAQAKAIEAIRPGVTAEEVDAAARHVIAEAGFGRRFTHGLGHGIGLAVHEAPRMAARNTMLLRAGMVITVEPGVYLPGWGGVRLEDDVLVTRDGCEVLSSVPRAIDEAVVA